MKKVSFLLLMTCSILVLNAQTDSSTKSSIKVVADSVSIKADTIQIGNILIVKNRANQSTDSLQIGRSKIVVKIDANAPFEKGFIQGEVNGIKIARAPKKMNNIRTNWFAFDLGYANLQDKSPILMYMTHSSFAPTYFVTSTDLKLNNSKSNNFNLWIVQQKVNLYKHQFNLKYGVGFEMFNLRLEQNVSFRNEVGNKIIFDNIAFSKNKLFTKYLTVPVQFNYKSNPTSKKSFYMSLGMSAGYLVDSRNKQKSTQRGKQKYDGNFNLNNWRVATIGELGIGSIRLYGSYGITNLFDKTSTYIDMAPYAIGLRFSKF